MQQQKSFSRSDKYNEFLNSFKEGDYVMIAFTNEDKYTSDDIKYYSSPYGNVDTTGSYEQFLYYSYVKPVLDKKAIPILVTPYYERTEENGELTATENPYVNAVKDLVVSKQLFFVNMYDLSKNLYDVMGAEGSKVLNAYDANGKICVKVHFYIPSAPITSYRFFDKSYILTKNNCLETTKSLTAFTYGFSVAVSSPFSSVLS